ncbi:cytochrome P450 [Saccharopolyspora shandongensis]|uniref:cytochrome P450 n=1 Tax=Saccharopolyspora shandongensis TaxID=418495 RepID=UPI00342E3E00
MSDVTREPNGEKVSPAFKPYDGKADHPWEELAHDRARCPVVHHPELNSIQVTTYEGMKTVTRNNAAFSSTHSASWPMEKPVPVENQVFAFADPPRHTRQRRLVVKALSASRIESMRPFAERTANDLIDAVVAKGDEFDLMADLAEPMSEAHICELLGIPDDVRQQFLHMSMLTDTTAQANSAGTASPEVENWRQFLKEAVQSRRAAGPGSDDLLTTLCFAEEDGYQFDENEIGLVLMGLIAGGGSTGPAIGNLAYALEQHPEQKAKYLADIDGLTDAAVDEGFRYDGPILGLYRMTLQEGAIQDGFRASPGDRIWFSLAAANHDPEAFDRPDEFILDRNWSELPPVMAFGHGPHHCIGMNLGRLQVEVGISTLYKRLPNLRLRPGFQPHQIPGPLFRAWTSLEMVYDGPARPRTDVS